MTTKVLMLVSALFSGGLFASCTACLAQFAARNLRCENQKDPIGVDKTAPRFSWQIQADNRNFNQTAYEIRVTLDGKTAWSTGQVHSDQQLLIPYGGTPLQPSKRYDWKVRIWDSVGKASPWSPTGFFQTALLSKEDWKAVWIQPGYEEAPANRPSPTFRKEFSSRKGIQSATVYITSHGLYEARLNGEKIGDAYLTPGWTSYHKRLQYQMYDVTALVRPGRNGIGVTLGSGWYRGYIAFQGKHEFYGKDASLLFQLEITYTDGTRELICSDGSWQSSTGSIRYAKIYNGEKDDATQEQPGWDQAGFDDSRWSGVKEAAFSLDNLVATESEPVRAHEIVAPTRIFTTPRGERVIDFGQNLVGWVRLKVNGQRGDRVILSHAEVLDHAGNFYTDNLRLAHAQDTFILKGGGQETFEPHFTWHGFRYLCLDGYPGDIKPEDVMAVVLYSDMARTGNFSCSNPLINQLQHNIEWGQKGNFLDVPTDCPQRDERLGWTGDAQVFSRTAMFNRGVEAFFTKWLKDLSADQWSDGSVENVVPDVLGPSPIEAANAGWAEAATVIPWNLYLAYGDTQVLKAQYASMKAWVDAMHAKSDSNELWATGHQLGDWCAYSPDDDHAGKGAITDKYLIAQCFYACSTEILIKAAKVLGNETDVETYTKRLEKIKKAFCHTYLTPAGLLMSNTQTAYVLALQFDMLPDSLRASAAQRLVQNIKDYNYHLTTGFLGTPYICPVLTRFGHLDIAYRLLEQETYPSWLYPVKMGATTIWERWDGIKPDSSFQKASMNSFNHYAYGAIGEWMYEVVAGIDTYEDGPGYKHSRIQPQPGGHLTHAEADLETPYGLLSSHWRLEGDSLFMDVVIPANTRSEVFVPDASGANHYSLGSGSYLFKSLFSVQKQNEK